MGRASSAQLLRGVLLVVMIGWVFVMAEFPAVYYGPRMKTLVAGYHGSQSGNLPAGSRLERKMVQREITAIEILLGAVFFGSLALFVRAGRRLYESQA